MAKQTKTELQRLISKLGIASRKSAAEMIIAGQVKVNGVVCKDPAKGFDSRAIIELNGNKLIHIKKHYLILNKPQGLVVTQSDEKNRPTVYQCLKDWKGPLLQAVGRLDLASEGLLIFTNDHRWANRIMDPKTHVKKIYHVQVSPIPTQEILDKLSAGILIEGIQTLPANFTFIRSGEKNSWLSVELHEGRNRQIRKMLESENINVLRLIRVQIGKLTLDDLPKGQWRELNSKEIISIV